MTAADEILLEIEAELADEKARRIRARLNPAGRPAKKKRRPTQPIMPRDDELPAPTSIADARVTRSTRPKGMVER